MSVDSLLGALAVVIAYCVLCWVCLRRSKEQVESSSTPCEILIGFASQSGEAEQLALRQAEYLAGQGRVKVMPLNQIAPDLLARVPLALFVVSTYGEGESPDNALRFARQWTGGAGSTVLNHLHFAVLALGDSAYRFFCGFGIQLAAGLEAHGAHSLFAPVLVDRLAPPHLQLWQEQLAESGIADAGQLAPVDHLVPFERSFTLASRVLQNRGSPGGPVYLLAFAESREPSSEAPPLHWQAGDIVRVAIPGSSGQIREYSIASLPEDGVLELVVRQLRKDDGSLGQGSGFLTQTLAAGGTVALSVRSNPGFHAPVSSRPMILIGNGTGIAGLRSHLRQRERRGTQGDWLIFGERTEQFDALFHDEVSQWQSSGVLARMDWVFSRDGGEHRYVQHRLDAQKNTLRDWIDSGAAIYICGSQVGMAPAVHRTLVDVLGEAALEALILEGRYRRDIY